MDTPITRVLALLELLQANGQMNGAALAARLAVDQRTLRRYIRTLASLGVPIASERGRDGGYRLMHGFKLPPMMFTNDEAVALALGLLASRKLNLDTSVSAADSALAKFRRVMPDNLRQRIHSISETVSLGMQHAGSTHAAVLATVSEATRRQQRLRMAYLSAAQAASDRDVDPYGLACLEGHWYMVGYCHLRQETRSFRLDRVRSCVLLPASFAAQPGFDALAYVVESISTLPRSHLVRVRLHTTLERARAAIPVMLGVLESIPGATLLHCHTDDLDWTARQLAQLPFAFAIEDPAQLRDALARHAGGLLAACSLKSGSSA